MVKSRKHSFIMTATFDRACGKRHALASVRDCIHGVFYPPQWSDSEPGQFVVRGFKRIPSANPATATCMEDLAAKDASERAADPVKAALQDCLGALAACVEQIEQMRGMFDDSDGTIADALEAAEDAQEKARAVIG